MPGARASAAVFAERIDNPAVLRQVAGGPVLASGVGRIGSVA